MEIGDATLALIDDAINLEQPAQKIEHYAMNQRSYRRKRSLWKKRVARTPRASQIGRSLGTKCTSIKLRAGLSVVGSPVGGVAFTGGTDNLTALLTGNADWPRLIGLYARVICSSVCIHYAPTFHDQVAGAVNITSPPLYMAYDSTTSTVPTTRADVIRFNKMKMFSMFSGGTQKWAFKLGQPGSQIQASDAVAGSAYLGYIQYGFQPSQSGVNYGNYIIEYNLYFMDRR